MIPSLRTEPVVVTTSSVTVLLPVVPLDDDYGTAETMQDEHDAEEEPGNKGGIIVFRRHRSGVHNIIKIGPGGTSVGLLLDAGDLV